MDGDAARGGRRYVIDEALVAHDTLDGEVIIIHRRSGVYYSAIDSAATCWNALAGGADLREVAQRCADHHGVDVARVEDDLRIFCERLAADGLITAGDTEPAALVELPAETAGTPWTTPAVTKYSDIRDLLVHDPIHDVDPTGWPNVTAD